MKNTLLILFLLTVISSCHNPSSTADSVDSTHSVGSTVTGSGKDTLNNEHRALQDYRQWISTLDTGKIGNAQKVWQRFQQTFSKQPPETCDTAFTIFDHFHERQASFLVFSADSFRRFPDTLKANGMRIDMEEGSPYIVRDWAWIAKNFSGATTQAMKEFLQQTAKEDKEGLQEDGGLTITPAQLVDRAVWWEEFKDRNPAFIYRQKAHDNDSAYQMYLMAGMDNTPSSDESSHPTAYFQTAYKYLEAHYPQSATNTILAPYYRAWQKGDTATVRQIREKYIPPHP